MYQYKGLGSLRAAHSTTIYIYIYTNITCGLVALVIFKMGEICWNLFFIAHFWGFNNFTCISIQVSSNIFKTVAVYVS